MPPPAFVTQRPGTNAALPQRSTCTTTPVLARPLAATPAAAPTTASSKHSPCSSSRSAVRCKFVTQASGSSREMTEEERASEVLSETTRRIKALGQQGRMKDAITSLAALSQQGVQPDTQAATTLLRACSKDMALAQSVFDELFGDFLQPDEVTFAVLLRGYGARSPPDWPRMDACLTAMKTKYNVEATAISYNALLEVCCRTNDLNRGQDVIDRMAADGVEPDEFSLEVVAKKRVLRSYLKKSFS